MTRWIRYEHEGTVRFGTLEGETIAVHEGDPFAGARPTGATVALAQARVLHPVEAGKMIGLWNNFHALAAKLNLAVPAEPLYFVKANGSYAGPGATIRRPPGYEGKVIYEGELGIVVGRTARGVSEEAAPEHILGYTCVNDVTAVGILNEDPSFAQWTRAKSFDTFGVFGPVIATGLDPLGLTVRTILDGQERQAYPVSDMIFPPARLVSRISRDLTLHPGDVILCGTSVGVGSMRPGSEVEVSIEGIGSLRNRFE